MKLFDLVCNLSLTDLLKTLNKTITVLLILNVLPLPTPSHQPWHFGMVECIQKMAELSRRGPPAAHHAP